MRSFLTLFVLLCAILEYQAVAFLAKPTTKTISTSFKNEGPSPSTSVVFKTQQWKSATLNGKKTKGLAETENDPPSTLGLLITYMTPWRNPNSIFVYMLLLLIVLGKYSETHIVPVTAK